MAGEFSNRRQAEAAPAQYAHIHIFFRPLPLEFFGSIGFYSEQVYDYDLWNPYRQGVHRLVAQGEQIYIENYALKDPLLYAGAAREPQILASITLEALERRQHCGMVFWREGEQFRGGVEPGNRCLIQRNGLQTYLVSEVELTETTWNSLDRGLDLTTHEPVWGSSYGALRFDKCDSYRDAVPRLV